MAYVLLLFIVVFWVSSKMTLYMSMRMNIYTNMYLSMYMNITWILCHSREAQNSVHVLPW
jgi:hypothetical protein